MFDAATDEMKRMRNQRKNESVINQMEAYSTSISRNEYVFNLNFELQRIRDVYDTPSVPNSPVSFPVVRCSRCFPNSILDSPARLQEEPQEGDQVKGH